MALTIIAVFALSMIVGQSEAFKHCKEERKDKSEYQDLYERHGIFGGKIVRLSARARLAYVCTWHFTEKNEGALVALATIALSVFTFTLAKATARLGELAGTQARDMQNLLTAAQANVKAVEAQVKVAEAQGTIAEAQGRALRTQAAATVAVARAARKSAEISEKALVELEAPFVYVKITRPGLSMKKRGAAWQSDLANGIFAFGNYGRTPARIASYFEKVIMTENGVMPDPVDIDDIAEDDEHLLPEGVVVLPNGGESGEYLISVLPHIFRGIDPEKQDIFFIGFVRYSDIFGNKYRTGFCFVFHHLINRFWLIGDEPYNYRHRENGDQRPASETATT